MPSNQHEMLSAEFAYNHSCCGKTGPEECIDVKERFGTRYRIEYEDPQYSGSSCPWHRQIACRRGFIAPSGGGKLYALGRGFEVVREIRALIDEVLEIRELQGNDREIGINFETDQFPLVAAILSPKRS